MARSMASSVAWPRAWRRMKASITSTADGRWRSTSGVAPSASSRSSNSRVTSAFTAGSGTSPTVASVTKPSVPSEPTISRDRSTGADRVDEGVEVVAADPAQDLREAAVDLGGVGLRQRRDVTKGPRHDRLAARGLGQRLAGQRRERRRRSVGQHHLLRADVIDGLAVEHRAGAARVVGHHAADGGAARRAHVGREAQAVRLELVVQLVEDDPRLDPRRPRLGIDVPGRG